MSDRAQLLAAPDHLRSAFTNRAHEHRIILAADAAVVIERALSIYAARLPDSPSVSQEAIIDKPLSPIVGRSGSS